MNKPTAQQQQWVAELVKLARLIVAQDPITYQVDSTVQVQQLAQIINGYQRLARAALAKREEGEPPKYVVHWSIDLWADSPEQAAQEALAIQRDRNSIATLFRVEAPDGSQTAVDAVDEKGNPR